MCRAEGLSSGQWYPVKKEAVLKNALSQGWVAGSKRQDRPDSSAGAVPRTGGRDRDRIRGPDARSSACGEPSTAFKEEISDTQLRKTLHFSTFSVKSARHKGFT